LVSNAIEKYRKKFEDWVPSKDSGIDLLLTDKATNKVVKQKVKSIKNYTAQGQNC
jgi:hypothetical protein